MTNQHKTTIYKTPDFIKSKMSISEKIENLKKGDPEILEKINPDFLKEVTDAHSFEIIPSSSHRRKYKEYREGKIVEIEEGED